MRLCERWPQFRPISCSEMLHRVSWWRNENAKLGAARATGRVGKRSPFKVENGAPMGAR
jgi:hypothetical protein